MTYFNYLPLVKFNYLQLLFAISKLTIETPEQSVKYIQCY